MYTGDHWKILQNDKICPSTKSDIAPFKLKHLLSMPMMRLPKNGWAQLLLESKKILALAYKGEEIKDSYKLNGKILFRLITKDDAFNYELPIAVTVDEIPF